MTVQQELEHLQQSNNTAQINGSTLATDALQLQQGNSDLTKKISKLTTEKAPLERITRSD